MQKNSYGNYIFKGKKYVFYPEHWHKWKERIAWELYNSSWDWINNMWKKQVEYEYKKRVAENFI